MRKSKTAWILVALLAMPLVMAQSGTPVIRATIPFAFMAAGELHPEGEYTFVRMNLISLPMWMIRETNGRSQSLAPGLPAYRPLGERSQLRFNCYGGRCFLAEIVRPGEASTYYPPCKAERRLLVAGVKREETVLFTRLR
jgi:hypothetical protein